MFFVLLLMILEVAILQIKPHLNQKFERAFEQAVPIIAAVPRYIEHDLQKCIEVDNQYIFLVKWITLEAHTIGFRQSKEYQTWKELPHHFYDPFPIVEHYHQI